MKGTAKAFNKEVFDMCLLQVANHYADKIKAKGMECTYEELHKGVKDNWDNIKRETSELYNMTMDIL